MIDWFWLAIINEKLACKYELSVSCRYIDKVFAYTITNVTKLDIEISIPMSNIIEGIIDKDIIMNLLQKFSKKFICLLEQHTIFK